MRITNPIPLVLNSTDTLQLVTYPLTLANVKFVISNPKVNQTITFYSQSGTVEGNPLTVNNSMEFKLENINYSKITFSDPNNYNIFCTVQIIEFDTQQEYDQAKSSADFSLVPINNSIITSPLDSNGYVQVDLETPLPSGSNTIGNININGQTDSSGEIQAFEFTTSSTANTATQLSSDSTLIEEITILASSANTATVNIGNNSSQPFPLVAGSSLTLRKVKPSNIYAISSSASQTLYIIYGGA
ncbi:MAG: hypothetical protein QW478_13455 [Candidatus Micrarchaeaceae archaeon]